MTLETDIIDPQLAGAIGLVPSGLVVADSVCHARPQDLGNLMCAPQVVAIGVNTHEGPPPPGCVGIDQNSDEAELKRRLQEEAREKAFEEARINQRLQLEAEEQRQYMQRVVEAFRNVINALHIG